MPKVFKYSLCGEQHKRPVGAKCQMQSLESTDSNVTRFSNRDDTNTQTISALNAVSSRLTAIKQQIERNEEQLQNFTKSGCGGVNLAGSGAFTHGEMDEDSDTEHDTVIPTVKFLKSLKCCGSKTSKADTYI